MMSRESQTDSAVAIPGRRRREPEEQRQEAEHGGADDRARCRCERGGLALQLGSSELQLELHERASVVGDPFRRSRESESVHEGLLPPRNVAPCVPTGCTSLSVRVIRMWPVMPASSKRVRQRPTIETEAP